MELGFQNIKKKDFENLKITPSKLLLKTMCGTTY